MRESGLGARSDLRELSVSVISLRDARVRSVSACTVLAKLYSPLPCVIIAIEGRELTGRSCGKSLVSRDYLARDFSTTEKIEHR